VGGNWLPTNQTGEMQITFSDFREVLPLNHIFQVHEKGPHCYCLQVPGVKRLSYGEISLKWPNAQVSVKAAKREA